MAFSAADLLIDCMLASALIVLTKLIREKVRFFQSSFIPVSVLAGLLGLLLGPAVLNILPFSNSISSYPGLLIILVFVTLGMRGFGSSSNPVSKTRSFERLGSFFCYREFGKAFQYSMPILFVIFIMKIFWPQLPDAFGLLMLMGFQGGHGTSAAVGGVLEKYGWENATDVGMTVATVTLLMSVVLGIVFIKIATKKGWATYTPDFNKLSIELQTGQVPEGKRETVGEVTVTSNVLDSLGWHLALVLVPAGLGYMLTIWIAKVTGLSLPAFSIGFLIAVLFAYLLKLSKANKYVDKRIFNHINGTATDYLVFFGITAIKLYVVIDYFWPLVVFLLFGFAWTTFHFLVLAPKMMRKHWFEKDVFGYGLSTGVTSISMCLLRIVDPDNKSKTLDDSAILSPIEAMTEIVALALFPVLIMTGQWYLCVASAGTYMVVLFIIPLLLKWWYNGSKRADTRKDLT
ncbi:sodium/glutamate symporter [Citrobacter portucalensis]|uniref:sodium/glutamate symporter n=1 Tax=Citrobacter portucalensis TaxID=1639133 RepID=UPI0024DE92C3|nr:sodium/glutamate symporter [Citrobacter portucalensis]MDK2579368.1 sodium/glutamate symporter [Citrobacter portucalensis]